MIKNILTEQRLVRNYLCASLGYLLICFSVLSVCLLSLAGARVHSFDSYGTGLLFLVWTGKRLGALSNACPVLKTVRRMRAGRWGQNHFAQVCDRPHSVTD